MGWTIALESANAFRLRYKMTADSAGFSDVAITANGSPSPDVITDSAPGTPIREFFEGLNAVPPGGALHAVFGDGKFSLQVQNGTESDEKITASPWFALVVGDTGDGTVYFHPSVSITNSRGYVDLIYHHTLPG